MAVTVDYEGLENAAVRVDSIASEFSTDLSSLGSIVSETGSSYMIGGPQAEFENKYAQFKVTMEGFITALGNYSKAMRAYAEDQRSIAQAGARRFDSI